MTTTSARETALAALNAVLMAALSGGGVTYLARNTPLAERLDLMVTEPAKSLAVLVDGEAVPPTALLGDPPTFDHVQVPVLELVTCHPDATARDPALDAAIVAADTAVRADPTLGGACAFAHILSPTLSTLQEEGAPAAKAAEVPIELLFSSESELG